jgi:Protein of unknown function (DUF2539).
MKWIVHQSIHIHILRVNSISNSSVLQIGTSGLIQSGARLFNTGGFQSLAPEPVHNGLITKEERGKNIPLHKPIDSQTGPKGRDPHV